MSNGKAHPGRNERDGYGGGKKEGLSLGCGGYFLCGGHQKRSSGKMIVRLFWRLTC